VNAAMFIASAYIHVDQLRTGGQHDANLGDVAGFDGLDKLRDVHTIDKRLQLGPTCVPIPRFR